MLRPSLIRTLPRTNLIVTHSAMASSQRPRAFAQGNIGDGVVNRRDLVDGVVPQGHKPPPPAPRPNPYVRPFLDKDTDGSDGRVHCNESTCQ